MPEFQATFLNFSLPDTLLQRCRLVVEFTVDARVLRPGLSSEMHGMTGSGHSRSSTGRQSATCDRFITRWEGDWRSAQWVLGNQRRTTSI